MFSSHTALQKLLAVLNRDLKKNLKSEREKSKNTAIFYSHCQRQYFELIIRWVVLTKWKNIDVFREGNNKKQSSWDSLFWEGCTKNKYDLSLVFPQKSTVIGMKSKRLKNKICSTENKKVTLGIWKLLKHVSDVGKCPEYATSPIRNLWVMGNPRYRISDVK